MNDAIKVLLIEDNPGDARLIRELLAEEKGGSLRLEHVDRLSAGIERLTNGKVDIVILDLGLPDSQGLDTFIKVHNSVPQIPIVILSGLTDEALAAKAVREGAQDYLTKGYVDSNLLGRSLRYAIERKRAEQARRVAEENFRNSLDSSPLGIRIVSAEGELLYANQAILDIYGYSSVDELKNKPAKERYTTESYIEHRKRIENRKLGKPLPPDYEMSIVRKDGEIRRLAVFRKEVIWGGKTQFQTLYQDITGRKQAEEALKRSERSYRELAESISDVFFALNKELRCIYWNKASEKVTGISAKDALGKNIYDLFPDMGAAKRAESEEVYLKVTRTKQPQQFVIEYQFGGKDIVFESLAYPSQDGISVFIRDVTDRIEAEKALRESEQKYRQLVEDVSDGYVVLREGGCVFANRRVSEILGYKPGQIIGKSLDQLMVADGRQALMEWYERVMRGEEAPTERFEAMAVREDGATITVEASIKVIQYEDKPALGVIVRDITERRRVEKELELRAQLLDAATDSIALNDFEGRFIYVNEATCKSHGYTKDELMGMNMRDLIVPEYAKFAESWMREGQKSEVIVQTIHLRKDKSTVAMEVHSKVIEWGGTKFCLSVARDITERKKTEEALKRSEQNYRELAESISDIFFALNKESRCIYWNKASEQLTGISARDALGKHIYDLFPDVEAIRKQEREGVHLKALKTKQSQQFVSRVQFGGKDSFLEINFYPSQDDGVSILAKDITERRRVERELELRAQLLDAATDSIVLHDSEGKLIYVNEAACRSHGYTKDELMEMDTRALSSPEYAKSIESWMTNLQKKGESIAQTVHLRKDKSTMPLEVYSRVIEWGGAKFCLSVARDITERKKTEERIKVFSSAVAGAIDGMAMTDMKGTITYVNPSMEGLFGYNNGEMLGKSVVDLVGNQEMANGIISTLIKTGSWSGEIESIKKNKETFPAILSLSIVRDEKGNPIAMMGAVRDISNQKRAEEKYRQLLEDINDGYVVLQDGKYVFANRRFSEIFGYKPEQVEGKSVGHLIVPDDRQMTAEWYKRVMRGEEAPIERYEGMAIREDGTTITIEASIKAIQYEDKPAFSVIVRDITGHKQTEKELELRAQLLDAATDSIVLHDSEGKLFYVNEAAWRSHGYTKDELMAMSAHDLTAPEYAESIKLWTRNVQEGAITTQTVHLRKDKSTMSLEVHSKVVEWGGAKLILSVARDITERKQAEEALKQSLDRLQRTIEGIIEAIALIAETRDPYTAGHQRRVAKLASAIAGEMGLSKEQVETMLVAGALHDIGKICVPAELLSKPGRLADVEMELIKAHSQVGCDILKTIEFPWSICPIVLQHHERMDGSGYPSGLSGEDITLEACILGVADVVEAMSSHRPYRPTLGIDKALEEISGNRGRLYDAKVVDACLRLFTEKGFKFEE